MSVDVEFAGGGVRDDLVDGDLSPDSPSPPTAAGTDQTAITGNDITNNNNNHTQQQPQSSSQSSSTMNYVSSRRSSLISPSADVPSLPPDNSKPQPNSDTDHPAHPDQIPNDNTPDHANTNSLPMTSVLSDAPLPDTTELSSGAFLTEAAWGEEVRRQQSESDEYDDTHAYGEDEKTNIDGGGDVDVFVDDAHADDAVAPSPSAVDCSNVSEEKFDQSNGPQRTSDQRIVRRRSSAASTKVTITKSQPPQAPQPKKHLFAYTALFGHGRAALAAARTKRINAIDAKYDADMHQHDLRRMNDLLVEKLRQAELSKDRQLQSQILQQQAENMRIYHLRVRLEHERASAERRQQESLTKADLRADAISRRDHDRELRRKELEHLRRLKTDALIARHREVDSKWSAIESEAYERYEKEEQLRQEQLRKNQTQQVEREQAAWKKAIERMEFKSLTTRRQALITPTVSSLPPNHHTATLSQRSSPSKQHRGSHQPPATMKPLVRTPRPPSAPGPQRYNAQRAVGGGGGAATSARLPKLDTFGKGRPRFPSIINAYPGAPRDGDRSASNSPSGRSRPVMQKSSGYGPGGVYSPSSKYVHPPRKNRSGDGSRSSNSYASGDDGDSEGMVDSDTDGNDNVSDNDRVGGRTKNTSDESITFWPTYLQVIQALAPPTTTTATTVKQTGTAAKDAPSSSSSSLSALCIDLFDELRRLVVSPAVAPPSAASSDSSHPAHRWTFDEVIGRKTPRKKVKKNAPVTPSEDRPPATTRNDRDTQHRPQTSIIPLYDEQPITPNDTNQPVDRPTFDLSTDADPPSAEERPAIPTYAEEESPLTGNSKVDEPQSKPAEEVETSTTPDEKEQQQLTKSDQPNTNEDGLDGIDDL